MDRDYVQRLMVKELEDRDGLAIRVLEMDCHRCDSAAELLQELAEGLVGQLVADEGGADRLAPLAVTLDGLQDQPLIAVEALMAAHWPDHNTVLFLKRVELLTSDVLSDLLARLSMSSLPNLCVVAFAAGNCTLPVPTEEMAQQVVSCRAGLLSGAQGVFERVAEYVFASGEIPVLFPRGLVESSHHAFVEFGDSVTGAVKRLLLCLGVHMEQRRSLLGLVAHDGWLTDMPVVSFVRLIYCFVMIPL